MRDSLGDRARLLHIRDSIESIQDYVRDSDFKGFKSDRMMMDAAGKRLAVIGEACDHLSDDLKNEYPSTEWFKIKGLRNRIIHQYFDVDVRIIWDVIQDDLPSLKDVVETMLRDKYNEY